VGFSGVPLFDQDDALSFNNLQRGKVDFPGNK
jgi:hypothetical protein